MDIMSFGIDFATRQPIRKPIDEQTLANMILGSFPHESLPMQTNFVAKARVFRCALMEAAPNIYDPLSVGWSFLVSEKDPQKQEIIQAMQPLALHRKMKNPTQPLVYNCKQELDWFNWMRDNCWSISVTDKPYYVLIIGGPDQVPFRFQTMLDSTVAVGRVSFDTIKDLKTYVEKIIRLEKSRKATASEKAFIFATDYGPQDPTFYSHKFMADPLSKHIEETFHFRTATLFEGDATKANLKNAVTNSNPALIYVASHGIGAQGQGLNVQKKVNGAICCQELEDPNIPPQDGIFSGDDVPPSGACAEGSAFFDFSCYGYGTPARSDFYHWTTPPGSRTPGKEFNSAEDFIAALPKRLLAHPRGPVGFFGHVDTAWLCAFADPNNPYILQRWSNRMGPFKKAAEEILKGHTLGMVLNSMNANYSIGNQVLTNTYDRVHANLEVMTPEMNATLVDYWITRTDAANYMLFGDPGTHVRIAQ